MTTTTANFNKKTEKFLFIGFRSKTHKRFFKESIGLSIFFITFITFLHAIDDNSSISCLVLTFSRVGLVLIGTMHAYIVEKAYGKLFVRHEKYTEMWSKDCFWYNLVMTIVYFASTIALSFWVMP